MEQRTMRVAAVMTAGRYENTYCRNYIEIALKKLKIPLTVSGGVYYGQCMQKMFTELAKTDCEYVVTVDGDSIFTADQLQRMISIVAQEDDIDALAAMQVRRGFGTLLGSMGDGADRKLEWNGYPIKVKTAHFGLTVINLEKLRQTPKPWFVATPDSNGEWNDDKVDDDVHFWLQWHAAGNSVYIDPGARIGHMEEMIATFNEKMQPVHVYPADWLENVSRTD